MNASSFGLDIGTSSIKIVAVKKEGKAFFLDSIASAPSSSKGILSESPADQELLVNSIKKLIQDANIKAKNVVVSLPESQVYSRIIEMPKLTEQEVAAALKFELEQYIPLPINQVRTDWQILEEKDRNGEKIISILIVASSISVINKYEKIIDMIGLNLSSIEPEILSVQRSLMPLVSSPQTNVIVHIGASTTDISIMKNGIIQLTSYSHFGGIAITRAVSVDLGVDISHAEDLKRAYGLSQDVFEGKIGKSLMPILSSLIADIKKTIMLYHEKNQSEQIQQIILSGGSSLLPGLNIFMTNSLEIQVVVGNGWKIYDIQNVPEQVLSLAPAYNVVLGLSLHDLV